MKSSGVPSVVIKGLRLNQVKSVCPECETAFEIDDRVECVFVDPDNPRLPIEGIVCMRCGLVQGEEAENFGYCGSPLNKRLQ